MKKLCLLLPLFVIATAMYSQRVAINETGAPPHASAILDINSSAKGLLIPRMDLLEMLTLSNPATGLIVYMTTTSNSIPGFYFYDGSNWQRIIKSVDMPWTKTGNGENIYSAVSGNVGIGVNSPLAKLHVTGGSVLFSGPSGGTPLSGGGSRMMWIPNLASFRAGGVSGTQWNEDFIGDFSFVGGGFNNIASGENAFVGGGRINHASAHDAFVGGGAGNHASGVGSAVVSGSANTAFGADAFLGGGLNNEAFGTKSFIGGGEENIAAGARAFVAGGWENAASGDMSFAGGGIFNRPEGNQSFIGGGVANQATGENAFVGGGSNLYARSFGEAVFGTYNTDYTPQSATSFHASDRLFVIGNGLDNDSRSNALTVLKNGKVGIGVSDDTAIDHRLVVKGHTLITHENPNDIVNGGNVADLKLHAATSGSAQVSFLKANSNLGGRIAFAPLFNVLSILHGDHTQAMRFYPNGKIGIGTAANVDPNTLLDLHIEGNMYSSGLIYSENEILATNSVRSQGSMTIDHPSAVLQLRDGMGTNTGFMQLSGNDLRIGTNSGNNEGQLIFRMSGTNRIFINALGNIGWGVTTPTAPLHFDNTLTNRKIVLYETGSGFRYQGFGTQTSGLRYQIHSESASHDFYSSSNAGAANFLMRIRGDGFVGIGLINPLHKLSVEGTIHATNNVRVNENIYVDGEVLQQQTNVPLTPLAYGNLYPEAEIGPGGSGNFNTSWFDVGWYKVLHPDIVSSSTIIANGSGSQWVNVHSNCGPGHCNVLMRNIDTKEYEDAYVSFIIYR